MIVCGVSLLAVMTVVHAEGLADPTRPPASVERPAAAGVAEDAAPTGLQTIIRGRDGKLGAIINGEYVVIGGRVGDARVVKIGEDSVTLKSATGLETLKLMPAVDMTSTTGAGKAGQKTSPKKPAGAEVKP